MKNRKEDISDRSVSSSPVGVDKISLCERDSGIELEEIDPKDDTKAEDENPEVGFPKAKKRQQVLIVICGFVASFQTLGIQASFGVVQAYHNDHIGKPDAMIPDSEASRNAEVSLIGNFAPLMFGVFGLLVAPALGLRLKLGRFNNASLLVAIGALLTFGGFLGASYSTRLWQLIVTQGILVGMGNCFHGYPITLIAAEYFTPDHRGKAMGLLTMGSAIGGAAYAPLFEVLMGSKGIRWTLRLLAVTGLVIGLTNAAVVPPPRVSPTPRQWLSRETLKNPMFTIALGTALMSAVGTGVPFTYGPMFAETVGFSTTKAALSLTVLNAIGIPFRYIWGCVNDKAGKHNSMILAQILPSLTVLALWLLNTRVSVSGMWRVFVVVYGMTAGGFGVCVSQYIQDIFGNSMYFSSMALVNVLRGIGGVLGPFVGGKMIGDGESMTSLDFKWVVVLSGASLFIAAVCALTVRGMIAKRNGWKLKA